MISAWASAVPHLQSCSTGIDFDGFAEDVLGVFGVLIERGDDLRAGYRFVIGMPAVVVGDHGDGAVTEFGFAGEFGFGDVGHADDVEIERAVHVGFGERGKLRAFHADVGAAAVDFDAAVNAGVGENARRLAGRWACRT